MNDDVKRVEEDARVLGFLLADVIDDEYGGKVGIEAYATFLTSQMRMLMLFIERNYGENRAMEYLNIFISHISSYQCDTGKQ